MPDSELPPLIRQMCRPDFYAHATAPEVRLVQTHISYVLLTGPYAYKVKKPVALGFLDFSTLEQRRHFCEEELRLNRRGAPGLYLDVQPVTRSAGGVFRLGGDGPSVEYALRMRQFPQEGQYTAMLARGELTEADMEGLAGAVAAYHAAAPRDAAGRFGRAADLRAAVEENLRQSDRLAGRLLSRGGLDEARAFVAEFVARHADLLNARAVEGYVRECHGDLHLGNVCRWGGRTLLFDCIEFAEALRWIDTMRDAAFAAMDLEARGRPDLANAFVNTYAERTADWAGLRALPLYLFHYAQVRAKVNAVLADDPEAGTEERGRAAGAAGRYQELALSYARPRRGQLVLMSGLSGSGKSTVARRLARRLNAAHLRSDAVRKHLAGVPLLARAAEAAYAPAMTDRTYGRLLDLGVALAGDGYAVVLDARYGSRAHRRAVFAAAATHGLPVRILHCAAPGHVLLERLGRRAVAADVSDATPDLLAAQTREAEPFADDERPFVTTLDTTAMPEEVTGAAVRAVRLGHGPQGLFPSAWRVDRGSMVGGPGGHPRPRP